MKQVELEHYGLYGLFDFLRSPEGIEAAAARKTARLENRQAAGDDRRETSLETGTIRRDTRVIKQENRQAIVVANNETSFGGSIGGLISSLFPKKSLIGETLYTPVDMPQSAYDANGNLIKRLDNDEPKTLNAGGWIMGILIVSAIGGAIYFNKKDEPVKPKTT